jgi:hypothetical protein
MPTTTEDGMNRVRRGVLVCAVVSAALAAGCASSPPPAAPKTYTETVSSLLLSEDGKHIAAIGASHHYIFGAPELVVRAMRSPVHPRLQASFSVFHVDATGKVTGDYAIDLPADASADDQREAQAIGLVREADGHWGAAGTLVGQRYTGWAYKFGREKEALNHPYTITFTNDASTADQVVDDAATPIRVAADGIQLIYYAPLAPIILPIIFATKAKDH